jgi:hypothetical protein
MITKPLKDDKNNTLQIFYTFNLFTSLHAPGCMQRLISPCYFQLEIYCDENQMSKILKTNIS